MSTGDSPLYQQEPRFRPAQRLAGTRTILQVVPALPPLVDGVGDFAVALARELGNSQGIKSIFAACKNEYAGQTQSYENSHRIDQSNASCLLNLAAYAGRSSPVILHYVGYGYDPLGAPLWLVECIAQLKAGGHRIVTIFHELYATGPPWRREFWNQRAQKKLFLWLAQASDVCVTSTLGYSEKILAANKNRNCIVLPIPSNLGEKEYTSLLRYRQRRLVICGQRPLKEKLIGRHSAALIKACKLLNLSDIWEIGPDTPLSYAMRSRSHAAGVFYKTVGWLPPTEVSAVLSDSYAGACKYDINLLGKSGTIASYQAHGVLTLLAAGRLAAATEANLSSSFVLLHDLVNGQISPDALEGVANSGFNEYEKFRSLKIYGERIGAALRELANPSSAS